MAADVAGLAEVAHAADVPLVVDQAWGPHFGFHEALPPSALAQGADAVLASTHKIVGSLTQSAMLHVAPGARLDVAAVSRAMRLLRTTSPSSLLMASLDAARRQLALHGEQLLHETLAGIARAREKLAAIDCLALIDEAFVGRPGVAGYDPLRIVLDVRATGVTGYDVADALRRSYDAQLELATQATIVLVVGMGEPAATLERVAGDVEEVVKRLAHRRRDGADRAPAGDAAQPDGRLAARRVPGPGGDRPGRARRGAHLVRVDRQLPAGDPGAAAGRAHRRADDRLPARARGHGRPPARRQRPDAAVHDGPGRGRLSAAARACRCMVAPSPRGVVRLNLNPTTGGRMPKYLIEASYTLEGVKGVQGAGGSSRRDAVAAVAESIGGRLESFHFAFGDSDAFVIVDLPNNESAAAVALTVNAAGGAVVKTVVLLTPEEVDAAAKRSVDYRPPGA